MVEDPKSVHNYWEGKHFSKEHLQHLSEARKGLIPWNKGISFNAGEKHPLWNKHHSKETIEKISKNHADMSGRNNPNFGKVVNNGIHPHQSPLQGTVLLRSLYELAYAKYLDSQNILWLYEPKTFDLGDTTYTPDFFLLETEVFIEIKGICNSTRQKQQRFLNKYGLSLTVLLKKDLYKIGAL